MLRRRLPSADIFSGNRQFAGDDTWFTARMLILFPGPGQGIFDGIRSYGTFPVVVHMVERQVPYCANGHDGIPMLLTKSSDANEFYQCPTCMRRLKLSYSDDSLRIKELEP